MPGRFVEMEIVGNTPNFTERGIDHFAALKERAVLLFVFFLKLVSNVIK